MQKSTILAEKFNKRGIDLANLGKMAEAVKLFKKANSYSKNPNSYYFLGLASFMQGNRLAARNYYEQAIDVDPNFSMAHNNLGTLFLEDRDFNKAVSHFESAISADPNNSFAYNNLGNAYKSAGEVEKAILNWEKTIEINPEIPEPYNNLGLANYEQGKSDPAIELLKKAIGYSALYPQPYFHLGIIYAARRDFTEAAIYFEKFTELEPHNEEALALLGNVYLNIGAYDQALLNFNKALAINPQFAHAINDLGNLYKKTGEFDKALGYYKEALKFDSTLAGSYNNMGVIYFNLGKDDMAVEALEKAISLDPTIAASYYHLGLIYNNRGKLNVAAQMLYKALEADSSLTESLGILVYVLMQACRWDELATQVKELDKVTQSDLKNGRKISETPFLRVVRSENEKVNLEVAKLKSREILQLISQTTAKFDFGERKKKGKIVIGYISCDFYDHATAHLLGRLFELHDREKFEVNVYSYGPDDKSAFRNKLEKGADKFVDIFGLSYADAAKTINADKVDILVDLKGYTKDSRLEIAALRPAPIIVSWLGFPGSTGADFIDYIIADEVVIPKESEKFYSEKVVYMPDTYQINDNRRKISSVKLTRSDVGLPSGAFVFSSFNHTYKIEPKVFSVWMRILKKTPKSVLWLLLSNDFAPDLLKKEAKKSGVDPKRLIFAPIVPNDEHLGRLKLSDLCLDTFLCNGHTTTSDALWAGIPVVTFLGNHFASRVSASLLAAIGLAKMITKTPLEYEKLAISMAKDADLLKKIKEELKKNRLTKPLFDSEGYVHNLEEAYVQMEKIFLDGGKPKSFALKSKK